MGDSRKIRTILFNILVILTLVFIYIFFFPKKSYVKNKVENGINDIIESTFNQNIENMKISSNEYFNAKGNGTVTLQQLIDEGLSANLSDSKGESCSTASYVEKDDKKIKIHLECSDKTDDRIISLTNEKFICIYQYEKQIAGGYTEWSSWSEWQKDPIEANELREVETEVRKESNGKTSEKKSRQDVVNAKACPDGTTQESLKCKVRKYVGNVSPSDGKCPNNTISAEYDKEGNTCKKYDIYYIEQYASSTTACPDGYNLSGRKCYKTIYYTEENESFTDVTYYRSRTRTKTDAKIDIKWSKKDDQELLSKSYNMVGKISCEF